MGVVSQSTREEPTAQLRYLDGALQQRWAITTIEGGMVVGLHGEWRDVPHVNNSQEEAE
jgi:hypothetical protein